MSVLTSDGSAEPSGAPANDFKRKISAYAYASPSPRRSSRLASSSSTPIRRQEPPVTPLKRQRVLVKEESATPAKKKRTPTKRGYASPEKYAHLRPLEDHVRIGLDVLFCGFNPGCMSAETGHHFANPTNHFWRALHQGGFTTQFVPASEDHTLPEAYNLGLTNLVERPSAEANELSPGELVASVPAFLDKIARLRPRIICFVGKGIWVPVQKALDAQLARAPQGPAVTDVMTGVEEAIKEEDSPESGQSNSSTESHGGIPRKQAGKKGKAKDVFDYGLQSYLLVLPRAPDEPSLDQSLPQGDPKSEPVDAKFTADSIMTVIPSVAGSQVALVRQSLIFVMPSTSGRVVSHQLKDKIVLFAQLKADLEAAKTGTINARGFKAIQLNDVVT